MKTAKGLILFLLVFSGPVFAQESDVAGISYLFNPNVGIKDPTNQALQNLDLNVSEFKAFALVPSRLNNDRTLLLNGLEWYYVKAPFDDFPAALEFEANLHSIQYTFGVMHELSETWSAILLARPTLASNFKAGITSDDFYIQGSGLAFYRPNERSRYGFGVAYINRFGEPALIPLLSYRYQRDNWFINLLAPVELSINFNNKSFTYGAAIELEGGEFHLSSNPGDGPIITNLDRIRFSRFNIGPTLAWHFMDHLRIQVSGGIALKRTLKTIAVNGAENDLDLESGIYIKTGIYFGQ